MFGEEDESVPKVAIVRSDLLAIRRELSPERYFEHARDWCACVLAWYGLLRIGEYMDAGLRTRHVVVTDAGLDITIQFSKASRAPQTISIARNNGYACPRAAYLHYRGFLDLLGLAAHPDDALFVWRYDGSRRYPSYPMTSESFVAQVRSYIKAAYPHKDVSKYAGHSFRRGGATALIAAGATAAMVQAHGRWSSEAYRLYFDVRNNEEARMAATQMLARA